MASNKKWLLSFIEINEKKLTADGFPRGQELSSLPDVLNSAVEALSPSQALDLHCVYLLTPTQKREAELFLEKHSLPYHQHAVDDRGEICTAANCAVHPISNVIQLNDRRP